MADTWTAPSGPSAGVASLAEMQAQRTDNIDVLSRAVDGDSSASTIKHRHKTGTLANRPAAGEAGRLYSATDLGAIFEDDGSNWDIIAVKKRLAQYIFDDFTMFASATAVTVLPAGLNWGLDVVNSGDVTGSGPATSAKSLAVLRTGATGSSRSSLRAQSASAAGGYAVAAGSVPAILAVRLLTTAITDAFILSGLYTGAPAIGASPTDGIYFRRTDGGGVGNWFAVTRASSTETATDTGVAGDANFHLFEIHILGTGQVKFYIDGTEEADHSTNIPTARIMPIHTVDNSVAANKELHIDYQEWVAKRA